MVTLQLTSYTCEASRTCWGGFKALVTMTLSLLRCSGVLSDVDAFKYTAAQEAGCCYLLLLLLLRKTLQHVQREVCGLQIIELCAIVVCRLYSQQMQNNNNNNCNNNNNASTSVVQNKLSPVALTAVQTRMSLNE